MNNNNSKIKYNMVDLKDSYDYELLSRFYKELMIPNFPDPTELEPLENWVEMFNENNNNNQNGISNIGGGIDDEDNLLNFNIGSGSGGGGASDNESDDDGNNDKEILEDCEIEFHIVLSICEPEFVLEGQSNLLGGVVFEYYPSINCGCITYLLVNSNYRGQGLAGILLKEASDRLMENANDFGHLGGCNCILLETNSAEKVKPEHDVMDPAKRHSIFHKLGIRLLDFDYVQPALSDESGKCKDLLLCCLLTPNVPKVNDKFYLPSLLLRSFLRVFWSSCCSRLSSPSNSNWEQDVDFKRMMDQVDRRERIQLLDLPWGRPWTLLDLRDCFDSKNLISNFYNQLLLPNFKGQQELEPLENWFKMLPTNGSSYNNNGSNGNGSGNEDFHLLVALRYDDNDDTHEPTICGGVAFEYHIDTNCGLITYFLVGGGNNRADTMANALIQRTLEILEQNAIDCGNLAGCNAIFLETSDHHNDISNTTNCNHIQEISYKKDFLDKMGWMKLDFKYIQPPLSIDKTISNSLNLLVLLSPRIPQLSPSNYYLPSLLVVNFIKSFWSSTCKRNSGIIDQNGDDEDNNKSGEWFNENIEFKRMIKTCTNRDKIPLLSINNWSRPFYFIDLAIDFNQDLFNTFYDNIVSQVPNSNLESKQQLQKLLLKNSIIKHESKSSNSRKESENIHILLLVENTSTQDQPIIHGSIIFSYFSSSNCGLISNITIVQLPTTTTIWKDWNIGKELLNESIEIINRISILKTHISGPNAIFLETNSTAVNNNVENELSLQWLLVDIEYYQPQRTLNYDNNNPSILYVLNTPQLPLSLVGSNNDDELPFIPKELFKSFISTYWLSIYSRNKIITDLTSSPIYKMNQQFKEQDKILLK